MKSEDVKTIKGFILYFDILGYKSIMNSDNIELQNALINRINNFTSGQYLYDLKLMDLYKKYSNDDFLFRCFSDNFIFVYKSDLTIKSFMLMIEFSKLIYLQFFNNGFLIRGSLSFGAIEYTDYIVEGSDLIKAYELENNHNEPSIILSNELLDFYNNGMDNFDDYNFSIDKKGNILPFTFWFNTRDDANMFVGYFNKYLYYLKLQRISDPVVIKKTIDKVNYLIDVFNSYFSNKEHVLSHIDESFF